MNLLNSEQATLVGCKQYATDGGNITKLPSDWSSNVQVRLSNESNKTKKFDNFKSLIYFSNLVQGCTKFFFVQKNFAFFQKRSNCSIEILMEKKQIGKSFYIG